MLPTARKIGPAPVGRVLYGAMFGCALPVRVGTRPL
ncbi:Uncharacterised protein [Bordetella pertussis]|nr:Uncharacterised protein [Bordetella pertussis]